MFNKQKGFIFALHFNFNYSFGNKIFKLIVENI